MSDLSKRQQNRLSSLAERVDQSIRDQWSRFEAHPFPEPVFVGDGYDLDRDNVAAWAVRHPAAQELIGSYWERYEPLFSDHAHSLEEFRGLLIEAHAEEELDLRDFLEADARFAALNAGVKDYRARLERSGHAVVEALGGFGHGGAVDHEVVGGWPAAELEAGKRLGLDAEQVADVTEAWISEGCPTKR